MIFYHITQKKNLKNILKEGLRIKYSWRFTSIFLSETLETASSWINILKEDYKLKGKFSILKVKVNDYIIGNKLNNGIIFEAYTNKDIPLNKIEVIK